MRFHIIFYENQWTCINSLFFYLLNSMENGHEIKIRIRCSWKKLNVFFKSLLLSGNSGTRVSNNFIFLFLRWSSGTTWCPPEKSNHSLKFECIEHPILVVIEIKEVQQQNVPQKVHAETENVRFLTTEDLLPAQKL